MKWWLVASVAVIVFIPSGTLLQAQARPAAEAEAFLQEAVRQQDAGSYQQAKSFYRKAWAAGAWDTAYKKAIFNNMGALFLETGSVDEAGRMLDMALAIDPLYRPALLNKGLIFERENSRQASVEHWQKLLDIDVDSLVMERRPTKAVFSEVVPDPDFWNLAAEDPDYKKAALNNAGTVYLAIGEAAKAQKLFQEALEIDPEYHPAKMNLGLVYERTRSPEEARAYWDETFAISLDDLILQQKPIDLQIVDDEGRKDFWLTALQDVAAKKVILNNMGALYLKLGDAAKAEQLIRKALEIDPEFEPAKMNLGLVYDRIKTPEEAREYWFKALDIDVAALVAEQKPAEVQIVEAASDKGYWLRAAEDVEGRKAVLNNLGTFYIKTGDLAKAEEVLREVLSIDPAYEPSRLNLGLVYDRTRSEDEALAYWRSVLSIDGEQIIAEQKPADVQIAAASDDQRSVSWIGALDDAARRKELFNNMGVLYAKSGDWLAAEDALQEALRIDPEFEQAQMNLGIVYDQNADKETSRAYWQKVLSIDVDKEVANAMPKEAEVEVLNSDPDSWIQASADSAYRKEIFNNLGALYLISGNLDSAEAMVNEALSIDPEYKEALLNLGLIMERRSGPEQNLAYWRRVLDISLDSAVDELKPANAVVVPEVNAAGVGGVNW